MTEKKEDENKCKIISGTSFKIVGAVDWARVEGKVRVEWESNDGTFKIKDVSNGKISVHKIVRDFKIGTDGAKAAETQITLFLKSSEQIFGKDKTMRVTIETIDPMEKPTYVGLL